MTPDHVIAGHRVLRLLARGDRSRVWLAAGDLVLKVLTRPWSLDQPSLEAQALHRARGEHVVELADVSASDESVVLVFPRLPRGSLAELLAARAGLDAGEAVTILAPIAAAVARMHERGVAHGRISAANVLFRSDGAPMLIGFGNAQLFEADLPEVQREVLSPVVDDRAALAGLVDAVLARVTGPRAAAAANFATQWRAASHIDLEARLGRELFELAAARPVVFEMPDHAPASHPARAIPVDTSAPPLPRQPTRAESGAVAGLRAALTPVLESGPGDVARRWVSERWAAFSPGRRRLVVGGGAALLAVVIAAAAVPGSNGNAAPDLGAATPSSPSAPEATFPPVAPSVVTGDDPLAALPALLDRRTQCLRDLSVLCFDDVDESGSSAWDDDRAALDALVASGVQPTLMSGVGASLVERLGESALILLAPDSDPASVLLMKGEAGWRVRDYLASAGQPQ
jgi:hypothetical protein